MIERLTNSSHHVRRTVTSMKQARQATDQAHEKSAGSDL
jgi:hypothetical protein